MYKHVWRQRSENSNWLKKPIDPAKEVCKSNRFKDVSVSEKSLIELSLECHSWRLWQVLDQKRIQGVGCDLTRVRHPNILTCLIRWLFEISDRCWLKKVQTRKKKEEHNESNRRTPQVFYHLHYTQWYRTTGVLLMEVLEDSDDWKPQDTVVCIDCRLIALRYWWRQQVNRHAKIGWAIQELCSNKLLDTHIGRQGIWLGDNIYDQQRL